MLYCKDKHTVKSEEEPETISNADADSTKTENRVFRLYAYGSLFFASKVSMHKNPANAHVHVYMILYYE